MSHFSEWLMKPREKALWRLAVIIALFDVAYCLAFVQFRIVGIDDSILNREGMRILSLIHLVDIIISATLEELIFRAFPISFAKVTISPKIMLATIIFVSIVFGFLHGGFVNIWLQGMSGFLLSVLYLKSGGCVGKNLKALYVSSSVHSFHNIVTWGLIYALGERII